MTLSASLLLGPKPALILKNKCFNFLLYMIPGPLQCPCGSGLELLQNFPTRPLTQISCCSLFFLLWRSFSVADAGLRLAIGTFQNRTATQRGRGHLFPEKFQAGAASGGGAREDCSMRQGVGESDSEVPCTSGMVGDRGVSPCPSPHSQG